MADDARPKRERVARVRVCSLWRFEFTDKAGAKHGGLSGSIGNNVQYTVLPNLWRKNEKQPTHYLYLDESRIVKEQKSAVDADQDGGGCNGGDL